MMGGRQDIRGINQDAGHIEPAVPTSPFSTSGEGGAAPGFQGGVQGSILYRGAKEWKMLGPGTSGQALGTKGADADPAWVDAAGGTAGDAALTNPGAAARTGQAGTTTLTNPTYTLTVA